MRFDPYRRCPAGKPEKVKFCCRDLVGELGRLAQLAAADQYAAYQRHLEDLLRKYPDRACLRVKAATRCLEDGDSAAAAELLEPILAQEPVPPLALALSAPQLVASGNVKEGVRRWYAGVPSVLTSEDRVPLEMSAYYVLLRLIKTDAYLAAWHLGYIVALFAETSAENIPVLNELHSWASSVRILAVPPLCGNPYPVGDVPWAEAFRASSQCQQQLQLVAELGQLEHLVAAHPTAQHAWFRLGCVRGILADNQGAVQAFRQAAALEGCLDLAVLAESFAQLLEPQSTLLVQPPCLAWEVREVELLKSHVETHPRCFVRIRDDAKGMWVISVLEHPPPAAPDEDEDGSLQDVLAEWHLLFGDQFKHPVLVAWARSAAGMRQFPQVVHDVLGNAPGGEPWLVRPLEAPDVPRIMVSDLVPIPLMSAVPHLAELQEAVHRLVFKRLEAWQKMPSPHLEGQTPEAAAADQRLRIKLLALLLNWEAAYGTQDSRADSLFAAVRERLGLPQPRQVECDPDLPLLPVALFAHVRLDGNARAIPVHLVRTAIQLSHLTAIRRFAEALQDATDDESHAAFVACCKHLGKSTFHPEERLQWLERARSAVSDSDTASLEFDLARLPTLASLGKTAEALALIHQLESTIPKFFPNDPQPLQQMQMLKQALHAMQSAAAEPPPSDTIWTPEAQTAPAKPGLWLPDQE